MTEVIELKTMDEILRGFRKHLFKMTYQDTAGTVTGGSYRHIKSGKIVNVDWPYNGPQEDQAIRKLYGLVNGAQ